MLWAEAERAIEAGAIVRRAEWTPGWTLRMDGKCMSLRKPLDPTLTKDKRPRANAGRVYWPSMEAQRADDWEIFQELAGAEQAVK